MSTLDTNSWKVMTFFCPCFLSRYQNTAITWIKRIQQLDSSFDLAKLGLDSLIDTKTIFSVFSFSVLHLFLTLENEINRNLKIQFFNWHIDTTLFYTQKKNSKVENHFFKCCRWRNSWFCWNRFFGAWKRKWRFGLCCYRRDGKVQHYVCTKFCIKTYFVIVL